MNARFDGSRGYFLMEVIAAAAIIALAALALSAALASALRIFQVSRAVTQARLLAACHLEQAAAGVAPPQIREGKLLSVLTVLEHEGCALWQAEVAGEDLPKPLRMVGGP